LGNADPLRKRGSPDITAAEMEMTVGEFYRNTTDRIPLLDVTQDADLTAMFNASKKSKTAQPADVFLREHRKTIVDHIARWTALQRPAVKKLMESIEKRSVELRLMIDKKKQAEYLSEITVFATTLVMTHLARCKAFQA